MMTVRRYSGLSAIAAEFGAGLLLTLLALSSHAAEAPQGGSATSVEIISPEAEAPYQVSREGEQQRWLDPAVFTEISPLSVPDVAVKLPSDQQE